MPGNLLPAAPTSVFPQSLSTNYVETVVFPLLSMSYHDGTLERSLILDGVNPAAPIKIWKLAKRLTSSQLITLLNFWESVTLGGLRPFFFYDVFEGVPIGSNFDPTGANSTGRNTVYFRGEWAQQIGIGRADVPNLELVAVA